MLPPHLIAKTILYTRTYFCNPGIDGHARLDPVLWVVDLFVRDQFGGQETEAVVVQSAFDADGFAGTVVGIEMTPHFRQFGEGVTQAERTLPQPGLLVTNGICLNGKKTEGRVRIGT